MILTTNFVRYKKLPPEIRPLGIARGVPGWYKGERELSLAPTGEMLHMSRDDYIVAFDEMLSKLDPQQVLETIGDNVALLCWESPGIFCHRRRVAEWLEEALGMEITEFGYPRESLPAYVAMPWKSDANAKSVMRNLEKAKLVT